MKIKHALAGILVSTSMLMAAPIQAQALDITVFHNDKDNFGDTMVWWIDEIKTRTEGRVEINPVYNSALAKVTETLDAVRDGVVPMGVALASFMSGVVPALGYPEMIGGLPSDPTDAGEALLAIWPTVETLLEPQGVVPLWGQTAFGTGVICREAHLKGPADWKDLTVRAAGRWQSKQAEAMGATPLPVDTAEIYIALQNGTIDCALMNPTSANALRLYEVAPYYTDLKLPSNIVTYIINQQAWNDISEADRAIIEEVSKDATKRGVQHIMEEVGNEFDAMAKAGAKIYAANPEERQAFIEASRPIFDQIGAASGEGGEAIRAVLSKYW